MDFKDDFNVFVGGKTGIFKGVKVKEKTCVTKNIHSLVSITANQEVSYMTWTDEDQKEILIGCGSKGPRTVKSYNTEHHTFNTSFRCDVGEGMINGLGKFDDHILTSCESGHIKLWNNDATDGVLFELGQSLSRMRQAYSEKNIIATGGEENPLKMFDLVTQANTFTAKNVSHDWLELRVPINVSDLCFLENNKEIVTISKYGYVRMYDIRAQRRPVTNIEMREESLTAICCSTQDKQIICGTGRGRMNLVDLRKSGKILNTYKGPVGAVTAIGVSSFEPCIVSVSIDRYLYIHDLYLKKLLKKIYLTSKLTSMVLRSEFSLKEKEIIEESVDEIIDYTDDSSNSDGEDS